jgi:hypothetical protein
MNKESLKRAEMNALIAKALQGDFEIGDGTRYEELRASLKNEPFASCSACDAVPYRRGRHAADKLCDTHRANPWAGERLCPQCHSNAWTMPVGHLLPEHWVCVSCSLFFVPVAHVAD